MSQEATSEESGRPRWTAKIGALLPGVLVAATGVGAGDLMTASLAGSRLGVTVLWAALAGAVLKWTLNEGLARWQMATGATLLEGWSEKLGAWVRWVFLAYLAVWSFIVGGALVNACGVAGSGLLPLSEDPGVSKILWGVIHSLLGLALVWIGGFRVFEWMMAACVGVMFVAVVLAAALVPGTDWSVAAASLVPRRWPRGEELSWTLGVLGGVGGTVTLLSYGYWIRQRGRQGIDGLRASRLDLAVGYGMTALFGAAMIVIGSHAELAGGGAEMGLVLADVLQRALGAWGKWLFLVGFWGAVFSSLLGVWQSVPYLFADFLSLWRNDSVEKRATIDFTQTRAYRLWLVALALAPLPLLALEVAGVQLAYAVLGALFMPFLALTLLLMNNRRDWVGERFRTGLLLNLLLALTLGFFAIEGALTLYEKLAGFFFGAD